MKSSFLRNAGLALCALGATSCFTVEHFTGDPTGYDGLYFGSRVEQPLTPAVKDASWGKMANSPLGGGRLVLMGLPPSSTLPASGAK